jgi:predicted metal-binding protein
MDAPAYTIMVCALNRPKVLFGDIDPEDEIEAILSFCELYRPLSKGEMFDRMPASWETST